VATAKLVGHHIGNFDNGLPEDCFKLRQNGPNKIRLIGQNRSIIHKSIKYRQCCEKPWHALNCPLESAQSGFPIILERPVLAQIVGASFALFVRPHNQRIEHCRPRLWYHSSPILSLLPTLITNGGPGHHDPHRKKFISPIKLRSLTS
jgi:hypothetical protein